MRNTTNRYYDDLLVRDRTVALSLEEAKADLHRNFVTLRFGSLN